MSNQLYINGKPASLLQRILATIIGIGALVLFAFFGLAIFVIGLGIAVVLGIFIWWKTRKIRRQMNEEMQKAKMQSCSGFSGFKDAQNSHSSGAAGKDGKLYEGEFKEL